MIDWSRKSPRTYKTRDSDLNSRRNPYLGRLLHFYTHRWCSSPRQVEVENRDLKTKRSENQWRWDEEERLITNQVTMDSIVLPCAMIPNNTVGHRAVREAWRRLTLHRRNRPDPSRKRSRKRLICLIKQREKVLFFHRQCVHRRFLFSLPHPAPSRPRNSRRFESYSELPSPDNFAPMSITVRLSLGENVFGYHLSRRRSDGFFLSSVRSDFFHLPSSNDREEKEEEEEKKIVANDAGKVFYAVTKRSSAYSLSHRERKEKSRYRSPRQARQAALLKKILLFFYQRPSILVGGNEKEKSVSNRTSKEEKEIFVWFWLFFFFFGIYFFMMKKRMTKYIETNFKRCQGYISFFQRSRKRQREIGRFKATVKSQQISSNDASASTDQPSSFGRCLFPKTFFFWLADNTISK